MANETLHPVPSVARLISDLLADLRTLMQQQVQLLRHEIEAEVDKVKKASMWLAVGGALMGLGGLLLIITMVHLLQAVTDLPLWACYGIVGTLLAVGGFVLVKSAMTLSGTVHALPVQTIQTMKEDARWIKEQLASNKT
ncbi:MAG: phage holin family protein [Nitrospiraceae bacterium]